jgi:hypothetical protein
VWKNYFPRVSKNIFQDGNSTRQKLLELIKKLAPIVERMKFSGDEIKSAATITADEKKTEAPPSEVKITPAAFVQGKLKHLI